MRLFNRRDFLTLLLSFSPALMAHQWATAKLGENRVILDEGINWVGAVRSHRLLRRIKRAGFNVLIPCIWNGRGAIWPSQLVARDARMRRSKVYDPVEILVSQCHHEQVEVHPWFTLGCRSIDFLPQYSCPETPPKSFDLHNDDYISFFCRLVSEVIENYDVQGINLDYVRTGGVCKCASCREKYKKQMGGDLYADDKNYRKSVEAKNKIDTWQGERLVKIMKEVRQLLRSYNEKLILSVDGAPWSDLMPRQGQDILRWADEDLVDVAYSMNYQPVPDFHFMELLQSRMQQPQKLGIICGNFLRDGDKVYARSGEELSRILQRSRSIGYLSGTAVYYYGMLSDDQIDVLNHSIYQGGAATDWSFIRRKVGF